MTPSALAIQTRDIFVLGIIALLFWFWLFPIKTLAGPLSYDEIKKTVPWLGRLIDSDQNEQLVAHAPVTCSFAAAFGRLGGGSSMVSPSEYGGVYDGAGSPLPSLGFGGFGPPYAPYHTHAQGGLPYASPAALYEGAGGDYLSARVVRVKQEECDGEDVLELGLEGFYAALEGAASGAQHHQAHHGHGHHGLESYALSSSLSSASLRPSNLQQTLSMRSSPSALPRRPKHNRVERLSPLLDWKNMGIEHSKPHRWRCGARTPTRSRAAGRMMRGMRTTLAWGSLQGWAVPSVPESPWFRGFARPGDMGTLTEEALNTSDYRGYNAWLGALEEEDLYLFPLVMKVRSRTGSVMSAGLVAASWYHISAPAEIWRKC
ncbi:hypothetical protein B0H14DRAFT_2642927 [Mycena olivaceomarginata]|nr:hypothetical protein B0H14DRAFT_2642927 [Mycena olivaceomarginata]